MRNRVRQLRTLGSVRGGDGAATVTSPRARSRKRWTHAKGKPTARPVLSYSELSFKGSVSLKRFLSICNDLIFDSSVVRGMPSLAAAPEGP
jgi:hypothetical protein